MIDSEKLATLEDFPNIRENIGFHFTSKDNIASIFNEGLRPLIGDNASGGLGQSAIEKTYISYGLEGVLQLYNRLISASFQQRIKYFNGISHKPFIPDSAQMKDSNQHLSIIEGFEMIRQYMEESVYFVFDAPKTQYEYNIDDQEIEELNNQILKLEYNGINIATRIKELNSIISELSHKDSARDELLKNIEERNNLAKEVRNQTLPIVNSKRGNLLNKNDNPIMEEIEYNDERLRWFNQIKLPHNAHTRIIENNGKLEGVRITKDMLKLFSKDGKKASNGLTFLDCMLTQTNESDQIFLNSSENSVCRDCNLLFKFQEYLRLVEKYKSMGLLDTKPETTYEVGEKQRVVGERQVVDMLNIDKYPGLAELSADVEQYYEENRYKKSVTQLAKETFDKLNDTQSKKIVGDTIAKDEQQILSAQTKI